MFTQVIIPVGDFQIQVAKYLKGGIHGQDTPVDIQTLREQGQSFKVTVPHGQTLFVHVTDLHSLAASPAGNLSENEAEVTPL